MREERLKLMEEFLKQCEVCSLDALCNEFSISKITVRRDIDELCKAGSIEKIYGGARYRKKDVLPTVPYSQRDTRNTSEKDSIGRLAASIIDSGDTIFIDSGTTTPHLIKYVSDKAINVVTHSLTAIEECLGREYISVFALGGEFSRLTNSFTGENAIKSMSLYNISKAFMAATGATAAYGFTNSAPMETGIKKHAGSRCQEKYILIDHSKWGVVSLNTYAPLTGVTGVITDCEPPEEYLTLLSESGVRVLWPGGDITI